MRYTKKFVTLILMALIMGGCTDSSEPALSTLEGLWSGSAVTEAGSTPLEATFIQAETSLSGEIKVIGANNPSGDIAGSVSEDAVEFTTELDFEFAKAAYEFTGEVNDATIDGTFQVVSEDAVQGEGTFTLSKQ